MESHVPERKSKSLEDDMHFNVSAFSSIIYDPNRHIEAISNPEGDINSAELYRKLTEKNKERNEAVLSLVQAQKRLDDAGIFKHAGSDKDGVVYIMVFGNKYPSDEEAKKKIKVDLYFVIDYITSKSDLSIIYFHTNIKKFQKGPVASLRTYYFLLSEECQKRVRKFNVIHPNFYVKTRMLVVKNCFNRSDIFRKVFQHDTLKAYLSSVAHDPGLQQRIVGLIPADIHEVYIEEKDPKKKIQSKSESVDYERLATFGNNMERMSCTKQVLDKGEDQYREYNSDSAVQTYDIIGKHLSEFKRQDTQFIPEVFLLLVNYFDTQPWLYKTEGIFRINGSMEKIDELQVHFQSGNYYQLTLMNDYPHVVACYLKRVLRFMGEPLCTYKLYSKFKNFGDVKDHKVLYLKEVCSELPLLNKCTLAYLLRFFQKVIEQADSNKMTLHNLATVITPNIFRPFELTPNDLIYAGQLVEVLKTMIQHVEQIFC